METVIVGFLANISREILNPLMTLLALGAFVFFVWGVVQFIANADNDEKRKLGQQHMIWGIVGLVIIFGAKAIIALAANTFGVQVPK